MSLELRGEVPGWSYKFRSHQWVHDTEFQRTARLTNEVTEVWALGHANMGRRGDEEKPAAETEKG